ncbi:alpha-ketoglutarate-dependent dioxygenase AlkB [Streptomyces sp. LHD-70]|uniref:alpha-ketoglutarate-dependent dioxygenase AlkB family protein n=1 Tax=Streptomyces sp. LHD-70 TaxID=3072140 RepID=UPI00280CD3FA|nr:alpha-ketoglutarate-dependent dioxygenase AlkB [Streptomyces sp. LHD-70]MDQ8702487.1 alpha-ketoglutarate-dependent dioxygenase AlkB [Streptomyces sp. LHD-70]
MQDRPERPGRPERPDELFALPRERTEIAPGAVHVPDWLGPQRQRELVAACRDWSRPPAGLRTVRTPGGGEMTARQVCLGWHWYPYGYARTVVDGDGAPVKPFPDLLGRLAREAVRAAYGPDLAPGAYDIALVNFYGEQAHMGMHRDSDERADDPVVSLSLGDTCLFRFGNTESRGRPYTDVELRSGDLFVFGGPSRFAYHGVPKVWPGSGSGAIGMERGRLNITLRVSGLQG